MLFDEGLTLETLALGTLYGDQFTLSTQLMKKNYHVTLPHRRSTKVSLKTYPLYYPVIITPSITFREARRLSLRSKKASRVRNHHLLLRLSKRWSLLSALAVVVLRTTLS